MASGDAQPITENERAPMKIALASSCCSRRLPFEASETGASKMKKFIVAALAALVVAAAASVANAREDEPSWEAVEEFAHQLAQDSKKQGMSLRETANHLASSIWWSEKVQLLGMSGLLPIAMIATRGGFICQCGRKRDRNGDGWRKCSSVQWWISKR
jgi:hypothetical protein